MTLRHLDDTPFHNPSCKTINPFSQILMIESVNRVKIMVNAKMKLTPLSVIVNRDILASNEKQVIKTP